jgi:hypothetical protein
VLARNYHLILSRIHAIIDCEAELPDVHGSLAERSYPVGANLKFHRRRTGWVPLRFKDEVTIVSAGTEKIVIAG